MARGLTAIALAVACAACGRSDPPSAAPPGAPGGKPLAGKAFYRIDAGPPAACAHGTTCEAQLVLTMIAQRFELGLVPGHPVVKDPAVTLRPKFGMRMTVKRTAEP